MQDDRQAMPQSGTVISVGDDLYGLSRDELRERIAMLRQEIERVESELEKKMSEHSVADQLFGKSPS